MAEPTVEEIARAIATHGFGQDWDDFPEWSSFATGQCDLLDYARAVQALYTPALEAVRRETMEDCAKVADRQVAVDQELRARDDVSVKDAALCILTSRLIARDIRALASQPRDPAQERTDG